MNRTPKLIGALATGALAVAVIQAVRREAAGGDGAGPGTRAGVVAVEVALVERGAIASRRSFSGELQAAFEFDLAAKLPGRITTLEVDLADAVRRGAVVARLDDAEYVQEVQQATAELEVARASLAEEESALSIANRNLERMTSLQGRGVSSESQLDTAQAAELAAQARVAVAQARITRAEAALETARIRLGYTRVTADWSGGDGERTVARRWVDAGDMVGTNEPLFTVVELDPVRAVFHVPERDYASLAPGQPVELATQAFPGEHFAGSIARIAPVFRETSRQARVEVEVPNADGRLKPGMFVRVTVELDRATDAVIVPADAITLREDRTGVFVVSSGGESVAWLPVQIGIEDGARVSVLAEGLSGFVVTLGQQLLEDGARIRIHRPPPERAAMDEVGDPRSDALATQPVESTGASVD